MRVNRKRRCDVGVAYDFRNHFRILASSANAGLRSTDFRSVLVTNPMLWGTEPMQGLLDLSSG